MVNDLGKRYRYLIIDTNNLFLRTFHFLGKNLEIDDCKSAEELKKIKHNFYSNVLKSCIDRINGFIYHFGFTSSEVFFLLDNPMSAYELREMLTNGEYKHNRKMEGKVKDEVYYMIDQMIDVLHHYSDNFRFVRCDGFEADDLVYNVLNDINMDVKNQALLISADLDWSRGVSEYIDWYNYNNLFNRERYKDKYGFYPDGNKVQMYKSFRGDKSDCIPIGLKGIREELLLYIINKYEDMSELFRNLWEDSNIPDSWKKKIKLNQPQLKSNFSLVDYFVVNKPLKDICTYSKENLKILKLKFKVFNLPFEDRMTEKSNDFGFMTENNFKTRKW